MEKPCDEEMKLFSECLVNGNACEEFEEKYFKCMETVKYFIVCFNCSPCVSFLCSNEQLK